MGTEAINGKSVANKIATKSSAVLRRFKDKGYVLQFNPGFHEMVFEVLTAHGEELTQSLKSLLTATAPGSLGHSSSYSKSSAASSVASTCLAWEVGVVDRLRTCVVDPGPCGLTIRGRIIALGCLAAVLGNFEERMEVSKVCKGAANAFTRVAFVVCSTVFLVIVHELNILRWMQCGHTCKTLQGQLQEDSLDP
ncbi:hypothetical protein DUNSADRAFT_12870 [Dunaliella salina]|uniref:Encoded protein n=1 Tax=Dunaliella salina TaxID=3046 RepID=A0ABQ7H9S6_DUNSA|nr:hypothetical protein DUNSADRAFT_12870 [Dunaliella salina]|eukprot:KAF5843608.1 hypothetical protein DUNSADRAFT_12870 [Dunaliella salina]